MIPKADLSDTSVFSIEARRLYGRALDSSYRRTDIRDDEDRMQAGVLADNGYGRAYFTDNGGSFTAIPYLTAFTVARRDITPDHIDYAHFAYIEVEVLRSPRDQNGSLLAALWGATFRNNSGQSTPWPTFTAQVNHATARDADHSPSILAALDVDHPVIESVSGTATVLVGTLSAAKMWPTGADITRIDARDGRTPLDTPDMCTWGAACVKDPHPYGPFLPEDRDDLDAYLGRTVRLTITPLSLVQDNGLHIDDRPITFGN